ELFRQLTGENKVSITNPGIEMNIRLEIPDEMLNKQPYTIRNYKVIRLHTDPTTNVDAVDTLDASFNANSNEITFETDRFSVYALTYKDTYYSPSYPVTGIKVSPESITLTKKDETAQLTAEVTPSYADNKKVTWKSSDEKVAIVDENGKVTAVGNGTATITATSVSGSYTATVSVTVKIPVEIEKLTIEAEKETLTQTGETTELKVKIEPENADEQKLIWKSDNEMVAAVDENGKVTAVGNGTATITVTTEDGKVTASVTITVKVPEKPVINKTTGFGRLRARSAKQTETSVTLQWNRLNDVDGYLIYGNRCNGNGKTYKYKKLATITNGKTQTWVQKGLKKGTFYKYIVKAYKLVDGKKVVTDISISVHTVTRGGAYGIAKSVSVTKIGNKKNTLGVTLKKGQKSQITAKEVKKDNKIKHHRNLCYESSNTKVATVTSKGLIQAKGKGTCKIWVYAQNGVYKELTITVK
ncbi:MAG: Ig-like domain-containing protein, partial [Phoenicibacter congonensis]|nr:Ig-like domain-containing protein [Phoenicibacter congonensis]